VAPGAVRAKGLQGELERHPHTSFLVQNGPSYQRFARLG